MPATAGQAANHASRRAILKIVHPGDSPGQGWMDVLLWLLQSRVGRL